MSYRLDLDEYDEAVLRRELKRRERARERGVCDYCERAPLDGPPCKFTRRHYAVPRKSAPGTAKVKGEVRVASRWASIRWGQP